MAGPAQASRVERRKLEFREKIIQAALALFEQQGVAQTSVASIIKEADIAHKTFFNHFPTKDHLLQHIACRFSEEAYASFREGFQRENDPGRRVEYCFMSIARALEPVNPHYKALVNVYLISGAGASELQRAQRAQFSAVVGQIVAEARDSGALRPGCDADTCTEAVVGLCVATLLSWSLEDDFPLVEKMRAMAGLLERSLFIGSSNGAC